MKKKIGLIDTGTSNIKSVLYALKLFDTEVITVDSYVNKKIDLMVVPGIGSFKAVMEKLKERNLDKFIIEKVSSNIPSLFICVGMQILFTKSYEFGVTHGLNILKGEVLKIPSKFNEKKLNIPFIGWNKINYKKNCSVFKNMDKDDFFYFTHSFYVKPKNEKIISSNANYFDFTYCSTISLDNVYACQFHPEKSGKAGLVIYENFIDLI